MELARSGRICIDIDAAVIMTLGPFGGSIKSRIVIFGHQFHDQWRAPRRGPTAAPSVMGRGADGRWITLDERVPSMNGWFGHPERLAPPRSVVTIAQRRHRSPYVEQRIGYTPSKFVPIVSILAQFPLLDRFTFRLEWASAVGDVCQALFGSSSSSRSCACDLSTVQSGTAWLGAPRAEPPTDENLERR